MKEYFGIRELKLDEDQLSKMTDFKMSGWARKIYENSNVFYKDALLQSDKKKATEVARALVRDYFRLGRMD